MDNIKRCCFCGHSNIYDNEAIDKVKRVAEELITQYNVNEFWVGNYGSFDSYAGQSIRELKNFYPHIKLDLVIPYLTKDINESKDLYCKKCDNILVADIPLNTPKRLQIIKANEYMVDNSGFLICYIDHTWGGAVKTFDYARKRKLKIFNIAKNPIK